MPQGIDLSNLGSLAAALGVTQGLHALANHQLGELQASADSHLKQPDIADTTDEARQDDTDCQDMLVVVSRFM